MVYKGLQIFIRFKVNTQFKLNGTLLKTGDEHRCSEGLTVPASLVKPVVLLLDTIIPKEIQLKLMKRGLPAKKIEVKTN
jgi:hypothetical protein